MSWAATAHFYDQLRRFLHAGLTLSEALEQTADSARGAYRVQARVWAAACRDGAALGPQLPETYPIAKALISAGEQSGRLPELCRSISDYYQRCHAVRNEIISRSLYPVFLFHVATVLPIAVFSYMDALPDWAAFVGPAVFWGLFLCGWLVYRSQRQALWFHRLLLRLPARLVSIPLLSYMLCLVLEACLQAGMKYPDALRQVAVSQPNLVFRERLQQGAAMIEREELHSCSDALARLPLRSSTLDLCRSGERSGAFEDALQRCAAIEQERYQSALRWAAKTINGIIYGIAVCVAVAVIFAAANAYVSKLNSLLP